MIIATTQPRTGTAPVVGQPSSRHDLDEAVVDGETASVHRGAGRGVASFREVVGGSRLLRLDRIAQERGLSEGVTLLIKLEGENPAGSVKDRPAWNMLTTALREDPKLQDATFLEATSGNMGIALAMSAARLGLKMRLIVPAEATIERVKAMRAYGADVVRTQEGENIEVARTMAERMALEDGSIVLNQFGNDNNWKSHYLTTGPELWADTAGSITHFVSAMGTTGTVMGVSRFLKEQNPDVTIVGTHPAEGSKIPGIRKWSDEFVPTFYEPHRVDAIKHVTADKARDTARELAAVEGVLAGMSTGGALAATLDVAKDLDSGVVAFVMCDRGDRYLSSDLFG